MPYKDPEKQKAAQRRYHEQKRDIVRRRQRERRNGFRQHLVELKENTPCTDCGVQYPAHIMDFDHVQGDKITNLGRICNLSSMQMVEEEVSKCEIVCSNCHRHRTWLRQHRGLAER